MLGFVGRLGVCLWPVAGLWAGAAADGAAFWPSLLSVPAISFRMLAECRQINSRLISAMAGNSGPTPHTSICSSGAATAADNEAREE